MLNSPRLMDYRPLWPPRSALRSCGGAREACEGARERLGYHWGWVLGRVGAQGLPAPHGRRAEQDLL